ncbi:unnamed protein product [Durusdinium trenchii]|uniref:Uncharacterized protein n=1 Tax=Durusdinium trenchii TaxID=1381693 RepID=A0ABP0LTA9_9DINO
MKELQLLKFVDAADDGVVLVILRCLGTTALVRLASTSAFISSRLEDGRPTVLHRYVSELLAFACGAPALEKGSLPSAAPLRALCAAGNGNGHCEVLALALHLANSPSEGVARMFLDAMFRWELRQRRPGRQESQAWQAVEILLTALLDVTTDVGCKLVHITAEAVRQAERDLDALIEAQAEALLSYGQGYEATARQRSAAEFIRHRALGGVQTSGGGDAKKSDFAMNDLDAAIESLDQTIRGYDQEGYTLVCPRLVGFRCMRRMDLPYEHWWVRLDGPVISRPVTRAALRT